MAQITITSPTSGKQYNLWLNDAGKAVGCTCAYREHHPFTPCKHMNSRNTQPQYEGCDFCGRNHKSWNCPF